MSTPARILSWIFDGSRNYTRDPELLTPPPCHNPKSFASTTSPEEFTKRPTIEEDDDEFYDTFAPNDPISTRYDKGKANALPSCASTPPVTLAKSAAQNILYGGYHIATFKGTSHYSRGGSSTCGLASLNAIRLAFKLYGEIKNGEELVTKLVSEEFAEDVMAITASWSDRSQLEVEPILELPMFSNAFRVLDVQYRELQYKTFSDLLLSLKPEEALIGPRAACLTRTPEIIAIVHMPIIGLGNAIAPAHHRRVDSVYIVFDSHPRPNHPNGAGIQVFPPDPIVYVAEYLMGLFQIDEKLVNDPHFQWQVQLLGQVSYHVLAPAETRKTPTECDLNMGFLKLLTEIRRKLGDEQAEKRVLQRQSHLLEQEILMLKEANQQMQDEIKELKTLIEPALSCRSDDARWEWQDNHNNRDTKGKGRDSIQDASRSKPGCSRTSRLNVPSWRKATDQLGALPAIPSQHLDTQPHTMLAGSSHIATAEPSSSEVPDISAQVSKMMRALERALVVQRGIDQRNEAFGFETSIAPIEKPPQFDCCRICTENFVDEDIAIVEGCGHLCCRDCMRSVIQSKIEERRYPIPCPFCMADADMSSPLGTGGTIQVGLVETIGIPAELFEIFTEMQLAEHSVLVNCRKCSGSAFIDRKDYELIEVVTCPIVGCTHSWCKQCNQTIEGKAKHSCDGSAELESLMSQQGWKYCPGCRAPVEKIDGCNHMSCKTPGCNVHFCYRCDVVISRGGTTAEMLSAKSAHYRSCVLR